MTREQIEKAAKTYIDEFLPEHIDYTDINYEEDNYEAGRNNAICEFGEEIFKDGAKWRIDSVWCTDVKKGDTRKAILVKFTNGLYNVFEDIRDLKGIEDLVEMFAYIHDLLPERKEETK